MLNANSDPANFRATPSGTGISISNTEWDFFCHTVHWKYVYNITDYFNGTRTNYDVLTVQDLSLIHI